jgi:hypothetical protein
MWGHVGKPLVPLLILLSSFEISPRTRPPGYAGSARPVRNSGSVRVVKLSICGTTAANIKTGHYPTIRPQPFALSGRFD